MTEKLLGEIANHMGFAAIPGPRSARDQRPFAMCLATNGLWTQDRLMRVGYMTGNAAMHEP